MVRGNAALVKRVQKLNELAFAANTFIPKLDFNAEGLFGYESNLSYSPLRNMESEKVLSDTDLRNMECHEYAFSCRVLVNLLDAAFGSEFERARDELAEIALELLRESSPEGATLGTLHIKAMTLLLQVPSGGECQVWHTDEDEDDSESIFSILIPCHQQSAPVFLTEIDPKVGPLGVKPPLSLGDMVVWQAKKVTHAGSSADGVPVGQFLRVAVFLSVGSSPPKPGAVSIHNGPDADQWKDCVHPIIRCCVRCRRGVQPCEPGMKYCRRCIGSSLFQATAVVCQWCHDSDDHLHTGSPVPLSSCENKLLCAVWLGASVPDRRLCNHGNIAFDDMCPSERLLLHFDEEELRCGFQFWQQFLFFCVPDELLFPLVLRQIDSNEPRVWDLFYRKFVRGKMERGPLCGKALCARTLAILRVTALICGFTSLYRSSGSAASTACFPIVMPIDSFEAHSDAYIGAYLIAKSNAESLVLDKTRDERFARALVWIESETATTHCSCEISRGTESPLSGHHIIQKCPGPHLDKTKHYPRAHAWDIFFHSKLRILQSENLIHSCDSSVLYHPFCRKFESAVHTKRCSFRAPSCPKRYNKFELV